MTAYCQAVHNWQGRFAIPAVAGVIGPAVTLALIAREGGSLPIQHVAAATLIGAIVNVAIQMPRLIPSLRWGRAEGALRYSMQLSLPLLVGGIYLRLDPVIDRALGSGFDQGTLACLGNCSRIVNAAVAVAVGGLSVVAFPRLARAAQFGDRELARETADALRALVTIVIPIVAALWFFGDALVRDLFERGAFTADDTARVALFVRCAMGVVIGGSLGEITARTFYASHDMKTPTLIGVMAFTVGLALKFLLSMSFGPGGILAATSIATCGSAAAQVAVLRSRLGSEILERVGSRVLFGVIASGMATLTGTVVVRLGIRLPSVWGGLAGLAVYIAVVSVLIRRQRPQPDANPPPDPAQDTAEQPVKINLP
jgi:putative peptidoglycan lipid II flippase